MLDLNEAKFVERRDLLDSKYMTHDLNIKTNKMKINDSGKGPS